MFLKPSRVLLDIGAAFGAIALTTLARPLLTAVLGPGLPPYILPAMGVVALILTIGPRSGVFATLLSVPAALLWVLPENGRVVTPADELGLAIYMVLALSFCATGMGLRKAQRRAVEEAVAGATAAAQARLAAFAGATFEGIVEIEDGIIIDCNQQLADMVGSTIAELRGRQALDWVVPEDLERVAAVIQARREEIIEYGVMHADGSVIVVEGHGRQVAPGSPRRVVSLRDVTARKRAGEALARMAAEAREARLRLEFALERSHIGGWVVNLDDLSSTHTAEQARIFGIPHRETSSLKAFVQRIVPEDREAVVTHIRSAQEGGEDWDFECRIQRLDGEIRWIHGDGRRLPVTPGQPCLAAGIVRDITDQKLTEAQLVAEKRFAEAVIDSLPVLFYMIDGEGSVLRHNHVTESITGRSSEELRSSVAQDHFTEAAQPRLADLMEQAFSEGYAEGELDLLTRDRRAMPFRFTAAAVEIEGRPTLVGVGLDITEQRQARAMLEQSVAATTSALERSEERYHDLVDNLDEVVYDLDRDGRLLFASDAAQRLLGRPPADLLGRDLVDLVHPDDRALAREALADVARGGSGTAELRVRHVDGSWHRFAVKSRAVPGSSDPAALRIVGTMTDITEQHTLREMFHQSQKLQAIGQLAGGVAHDFNNLLSIIQNYTELVLDELPEGVPEREDLSTVVDATQRAAALTRQLLAFSRKQVLAPTRLDLNTVVQGLEGMLRRLLGEHISVETQLAGDLGAIEADPVQIDQVLLNLAVNARDAMPQGGTLTIRTANVDAPGKKAERPPSAAPGAWVRLAVTDTGSGMEEAVRARLFEPFFTTKEAGKGTGLGLATVYGIISQSGGHVQVESALGAGTTFIIDLPRSEARALSPEQPPVPTLARGRERLLVVEDEPTLRLSLERILGAAGFAVTTATSGTDALAVWEGGESSFDLLLTDVVMPGMSGPALARDLTSRAPSLPVLFMSGYADEILSQHGAVMSGAHWLHKPFSPFTLTTSVREALDAEPAPRFT